MTVEQEFAAALDALVNEVKQDRTILAAVLCGSLSHDRVWSKSDIDLVLVTTDDKKSEFDHRSLYANGVNVHAMLLPRARFRRMVEGATRNSFTHSLLAKGRLLYTHDESVASLFEGLREIGARDTRLQLLEAASGALGPIYKAHKWLLTRGDLDYTALWILYAATPLAQIEVIGARQLADREVIPQALKLNPGFFRQIYTELLNQPKTRTNVQAALDAVDDYMAQRARTLFGPIIDYLCEVGEVRSCTELEDHFSRTYGLSGVTTACEYLADQQLIGKASAPVRLTRTSNLQVQELAFFAFTEPTDAF